jgi:hypothetical protein
MLDFKSALNINLKEELANKGCEEMFCIIWRLYPSSDK